VFTDNTTYKFKCPQCRFETPNLKFIKTHIATHSCENLVKMYMSAAYVTTEHKRRAIMISILNAVALDTHLTKITIVVRKIYI